MADKPMRGVFRAIRTGMSSSCRKLNFFSPFAAPGPYYAPIRIKKHKAAYYLA